MHLSKNALDFNHVFFGGNHDFNQLIVIQNPCLKKPRLLEYLMRNEMVNYTLILYFGSVDLKTERTFFVENTFIENTLVTEILSLEMV